MRCEEAVERMTRALDGGVSDPEWERVQAHLQACQACAQTWLALQQVDRLLRAAPLATPPPDFARRAARVALETERRRQRLVGGIVLLVGSVGAVLLMGLSMLVARPNLLLAFFSPGGIAAQIRETIWVLATGLLLLGRMVWTLGEVWRSALLGPLFWPTVALMAFSTMGMLVVLYVAVRLPGWQTVVVRR